MDDMIIIDDVFTVTTPEDMERVRSWYKPVYGPIKTTPHMTPQKMRKRLIRPLRASDGLFRGVLWKL